jgi:anti-sigma B factor antagonist
MHIKTKTFDGVGVIYLKGKLMGEPATTEIRDEVHSFFGENIKKIVIDLKGVSWMNSLGMGSLMSVYTTIQNAGGALKLSDVTDKVHSLLMMTKLLRIFDTYDSVDAAVKSFNE